MKAAIVRNLMVGITALAVAVTGFVCALPETYAAESVETAEETTENLIDIATISTAKEDYFSDRDLSGEIDEKEAQTITLSDEGSESSSNSVTIEGSVLTIAEEGTYIVSGTLADGRLVVDVDDTEKVQIVLAGASINSNTSAALYVISADKVFLTLAEGTENTLSNAGTFEAVDENDIDAAVFSKEDLVINGAGSLNVQSPGGHGIVSKDDLKITGGNITVDAVKTGISGKDSVRIADGNITILAGADAIKSENTEDTEKGYIFICGGIFDLTADSDGISASRSLTVTDGEFDITAGGGSATVTLNEDGEWGWGGPGGSRGGQSNTADAEETVSAKGLKSSGALLINGGTFTIDTADDSVHANGDIEINGGMLTLSSGDDGMHSDTTLTVNGGTINVLSSYEGIEGEKVIVNDGEISIVSSDDGFNAGGGRDSSGMGGPGMFGGDSFGGSADYLLEFNGGTVYVNANGDGLDSNKDLIINDGYIIVDGPVNSMNGSLDSGMENGGELEVNGGVILAVGSAGMAETFGTGSTQYSFSTSVSFNSGNVITVTDASGNVLVEHTAAKSGASVIFSCPDITESETYNVNVDGTSASEVTITSISTGASEGGSSGGQGGGQGGSRGGQGESQDSAQNQQEAAPEAGKEEAPQAGKEEAPQAGQETDTQA